jgi:signal transduction histidine kinase
MQTGLLRALFGIAAVTGAGVASAQSAQTGPITPVTAAPTRDFGQAQRRIDSVQALANAHPRQDTTRVILLTNLGHELQLHKVKQARPVLEEAVRLSRRLNHRDLLAETLLDLADYYITLAEYEPAVRCLHESRQEFASMHDEGGEIRCLGRLAKVAEQQGQYAASLSYCFHGLSKPVASGTRRFNTSLKIQAGNTYVKLGDFVRARTYFLDALQVARQQDYPDRMNLALAGLGEVARSQGKLSAARRYFQDSQAISQRLHNEPEVLAMQINLAEVSEQLGQYPNALVLGRSALNEAIAADQTLAAPRVQALLGRIFLQTGAPDSAVVYGLRGLEASRRARSREGIRAAEEVLAQAYARRGEFALAYAAERGFKTYTDSLTGEAAGRRTAALQLNYELGQKQAQIKLLTQQHELDHLRQQTQLFSSIGLGLLLLGLLGFFWWQFRRGQAARDAVLRARLAADLRDDVGTLLRQISLQSSLLQEGLADAAGQRLQINRLSDSSRIALRQLNDVVWSLDANNDGLADLLARMRDYAHEMLYPRGIELAFEIPEDLPTQRLRALVRRNLYLIYKESVQNLLRHARGATRATVRVRLNGTQLLLEVTDNAQPVAEHALPGSTALPAGKGLADIAARATAMGGAATSGPLLAADGAVIGFQVRVAVPLVQY